MITPIKKLFTVAALALLSAGGASAQNYPTGTVTVVVPYSPGSAVDPVGRFIATELQELWGSTVVVDNKPGAGSTIGTAYVASAPADGSVLLVTSAAFATAPAIYKELPYDPEALLPVAFASQASFVLTGGANVKANTMAELIGEAKERKLFLATAGLGSSTHFAGELITAAAGIEAEPVHYKGGTESLVDLMAGRADIYVGTTVGIGSNIAAGQVKGFAVFGDRRADSIPNVPTTAELGIEGAKVAFWLGVFAPKGLPDDIAQKINADVTKILSTEKAKEFLRKTDSVHLEMSPAEFKEMVDSEVALWKKLADERGIEAQ